VVVFATAASRLSALERPQQCHEPVRDDSGRQSLGFGNCLVGVKVDLQLSTHQCAATILAADLGSDVLGRRFRAPPATASSTT
jgi:hypothetical protein